MATSELQVTVRGTEWNKADSLLTTIESMGGAARSVIFPSYVPKSLVQSFAYWSGIDCFIAREDKQVIKVRWIDGCY